MPNFVSLTRPSLQILGKSQMGLLPIFQISGQSSIKENYHNSRTSDNIDTELGPVTKRDKRNKTTSSFFRFMVNLDQPKSWIPDAWSVKVTFSSIVTFYLTKTENWTKKSLPQVSQYCFEKRYCFSKKCWYFATNADISKIKRVLVLKGIFSETTYVCVLTCQSWSF